ncbi:tryptophan biosynthesis modulator TrpM [Streptomyces genisteinicus]|uniref:tryptophan biosynthesis modulator TrpM n=1 Tax=Streptomyces genisteinicus TaxID=2768068 RepID=UPI003CCD1F3B
MTAVRRHRRPAPGVRPGRSGVPAAAGHAYARLARGCRPRGCRAPARRVHGRRVRYVIGDEPGQVNGMRWRRAPERAGRQAVRSGVTAPTRLLP